MKKFAWVIVLTICGLAGAQSKAIPPVRLVVDATEAPRKLFHARMTFAASPGALTLVYPKWIPGEHGPTGPIINLAGMHFSAKGNPISWQRDSVDMYAFHLDVPAGATSVDATIDFLSPGITDGFSSGASATAQLMVLNWNQFLLYPAGLATDDVVFSSSVRLPAGWKYGTSLPVAGESGGNVDFQQVSLTTLVDSPLIAGAYFRRVELAPRHYLNIVADSAAALEAPEDLLSAYKKLAAETTTLFGAQHYRQYNFLYTLSDYVASFGLEHHESSDDRVHERTMIDDGLRKLTANLLPHEFTHSWNGKYRRPTGLVTPDFQQPMKGEHLWVYEGLTEYLGDVLTARSGLWSPEMAREYLAQSAASLDHRPGRTWRPLIDTTVAAQLLYDAPKEWFAWRRAVDFYDEGELIWLEADAIIRRETQGRASLDDFCKKFHGGTSGPPALKPYTFDDVVNTMNEVARYDWRGFFNKRLNSTAPGAPLGGIEAAGWRITYNNVPNEFLRLKDQANKVASFEFSLGLTLKDDGTVVDAIPGMPAEKAGLAPGMKVVAVNGRKFSRDVLAEALRADCRVLIENGEFYSEKSIAYHDGERYPHLVRDGGRPDVLSEIWKPTSR